VAAADDDGAHRRHRKGITGLSASELQVQSAQGYRLIDFGMRSGGLDLLMIGALRAGLRPPTTGPTCEGYAP
jgi:hypothetical protein